MTKFLALLFGIAYAFVYADEIKATLLTWEYPQWCALGLFALFLIVSVSISNANRSRR